MTKSEAIDKIKADYLIESQKISAMDITVQEKIALTAAVFSKAISELNMVIASKENEK